MLDFVRVEGAKIEEIAFNCRTRGRQLVLLLRETPLHLGHLRSMTQVSEMGAIIMPPVPAFYTRPVTVDDIVQHTVGRVLDLFSIETNLVKRWGESVGVKKQR